MTSVDIQRVRNILRMAVAGKRPCRIYAFMNVISNALACGVGGSFIVCHYRTVSMD